ncbi:MAG: tRNA lysidine(34) synthetase TilS [Rhodobacteraceae bacterium]|nr:tRNA lysidine(34) synthetase TilS [Paracoccaceae bacterium]
MISPQLGPLPDAPLGVAVSGGGDSVALLMLLHAAGHIIRAATVDHQLRPESTQEAADVAALCARHNIPHQTLVWQTPDTRGNLQNQARKARRRLLADWARQQGLADIVLGHTQDDQAETLLMRLARGSGVDGLSGMAAQRCVAGLCWHRPMIALARDELREYLRQKAITWVEDPGNDDLKYDRIKARKALEVLEPLGLTVSRLAETADHLRRARSALETTVQELAQRSVTLSDAGELCIHLPDFRLAPREIQLRLLAAALRWVATARYRPRFNALAGLLETCLADQQKAKTLHGCSIGFTATHIIVNRELSATPAMAPLETIWDGRWQIGSFKGQDVQIKALNADGIRFCPDWRETGHSRASLLASPSLWQNGALIAAPFANFGDKWPVNLAGGKKGFYDRLITH